VNHSLTSFNNINLPQSAILRRGGTDNHREEFLQSIWRVAVGSISLAAIAIPNLQLSACITARYSQRRTVAVPGGRVPLITFTTSHIPILTALARSFVLNAFYKSATVIFSNQIVDPRIRRGIAAAMKVVAIQHAQEANFELSERCGNQGLFGHNQISTIHVRVAFWCIKP
jgi:acyl-CoA oxidase